MHAYLIVGGDEKTREGKLKELLSQNGVGDRPGQRFNLGNNETASLKIEDVREAEAWVNLKRSRLGVLIVEEADRLTTPAQHAFLKTLEEPGDNILIVLAAGDERSLLATVRSRCKVIRLPAATNFKSGVSCPKLDRRLLVQLKKTAAERLIEFYPALKQATGSAATLHRGTIKRDEGLKFLEEIISSWRGNPAGVGTALEAAATAHRRLKNNLNPTLALHQFVMDISA